MAIHTSFHSSGLTNTDYSGKSGTVHIHERIDKDGKRYTVQIWKDNPAAGGKTLIKDADGVWRYENGDVFRGGANS